MIMRVLAVALLVMAGCAMNDGAAAQQKESCKVCGDQQRACMKNYAGPTCKTEYRICMKSCGKK
jgi:hypothetical protein